jgi:hypothetical protein
MVLVAEFIVRLDQDAKALIDLAFKARKLNLQFDLPNLIGV